MAYKLPVFLLDDPEPWTPVLTFGGASAGLTYLSRFAYATQIEYPDGTIESKVWGSIVLSNKGTSPGSALISAFPVPAGANGTAYRLSCVLGGTSAISGSIPTLIMVTGQSSAALAYSVMNGSGGALTNSEFNNSSSIQFWGSYLNN